MRNGYKCILTCERTGKQHYFKSGREASLFLGRARSYVSTCVYKGFPIRQKDTGESYIASFPDEAKSYANPKPRRTKEQLCCTCSKAYGGCSWSRNFKPVEGWTANPTIITHGDRTMDSFEIIECPEWERG